MNENDGAESSRLSSYLEQRLQFCLDQGLDPSVLTAISFCSAEPLRQSLHYRDRNDREFPHDAYKRVLWDAQCDKTIFGMDRRPARRVAQNPHFTDNLVGADGRYNHRSAGRLDHD